MRDPVGEVVARMSTSHASGRDLCVIGLRGEGKTATAHRFAQALGYAPVETLHLYRDMTARDLLLRRTTTATGSVPLHGPLHVTLSGPQPALFFVRLYVAHADSAERQSSLDRLRLIVGSV